MRHIYSLAFTLAALLTAPYWIFQGLRKGKYLGTLPHRLALRLPGIPPPERPLWLHAVSVGEVLMAKPLIAALRKECPDLPVVVSTVTVTGQALARRELAETGGMFYFPLDWRFCARRLLRHWKPRAVVLLETEIWPNFLIECGERGIPVLLLNGRISDRSFPRYRRFRIWMRPLLRRIGRIGAQSAEDRRRFLEIGASQDQVLVCGNMKFDFELPPIDPDSELLRRIRAALGLGAGSLAVVFGSTMPGEEPTLLEAFGEVLERIPGARMILAPRRPERFDEVERMLRASGLPYIRRSGLEGSAPGSSRVLLLDSMGELRMVYSLADLAVIGGSFVRYGGHNPLEPAALGKAVVFGPDMSNFKEIARLFLDRRAARQCGPGELAGLVRELLLDEPARTELGRQAYEALGECRGATQRALALIDPYLRRSPNP